MTGPYREYADFYVRWVWFWVKSEAREMWRALPGPWWVKVAICLACLAVPGELDEIALIVVLRYFRARRARRLNGART